MPSRPSGTWLRDRSTTSGPYPRRPSVSTFPTATHTVRMPCLLHSSESPAASTSRAPRAESEEDDQARAAGDHGAGGDGVREAPGRVDREPVHRPPSLERDGLRG